MFTRQKAWLVDILESVSSACPFDKHCVPGQGKSGVEDRGGGMGQCQGTQVARLTSVD